MQTAVDAAYLRDQAARCRRLADAMTSVEASASLRSMAAEYEAKAAAIEAAPGSTVDGTPHPNTGPPEPKAGA